MKLKIIKISKPAHDEYESLTDKFIKRLGRHIQVESTIIKASHGTEKDLKKLTEILAKDRKKVLICCDENGTPLGSEQLAKKVTHWQDDPGIDTIVLVIGGPYGLSQETISQADFVWRLAAGVLPSDLAWLIGCEQFYRAYTIINGSPYHHQ